MGFENLGINENILKAIEEMGFQEPTEIQRQTIPLAVKGNDVIGASATGSGKTLAFGVGIIQDVQRGAGIQALILTPTRELADQIMQSLKKFSKYMPMNVTAVYGGVSINPQFHALERADVVVGTPGRILDHLERRTIDLSGVRTLVLDEADRMLDMGFIDDVNKIMSQCPEGKQTLLFSATIPPEVEHITHRFMKSPVTVRAETYVDPRMLHQVYYDVMNNMKFSLLAHLLKEEKSGLVMVFCNSRHYTDVVTRNLNRAGIEAMAIHGGLSQDKRSKVLSKFNSGKKLILVCTDVAARGLDIPGVSHVYNYEMPKESKQYIHRIGRTARAGKSGKVINLISDRDHENFGRVQRDYDIDIIREERPYIKKIGMNPGSQRERLEGRRGPPRRNFKGRRRSFN